MSRGSQLVRGRAPMTAKQGVCLDRLRVVPPASFSSVRLSSAPRRCRAEQCGCKAHRDVLGRGDRVDQVRRHALGQRVALVPTRVTSRAHFARCRAAWPAELPAPPGTHVPPRAASPPPARRHRNAATDSCSRRPVRGLLVGDTHGQHHRASADLPAVGGRQGVKYPATLETGDLPHGPRNRGPEYPRLLIGALREFPPR